MSPGTWQLPAFVAIDAFFIYFFLLRSFPTQQDFNTAIVFGLGYAVSIIAVLYIRSHGISVKFEQNLTPKGAKITLGLAAVLAAAIAFSSRQIFSVVFLPRGSVLSGVPSNVSDAIYNFMLVAPSEEFLVLALLMALIYVGRRGGTLSFLQDPYVAAGVARLGWASLHSILAYGNNLQAIMIAAAMGFAFTVVMFYTGSVLSAIILHGTWNATLLLLPTFGALSLAPGMAVAGVFAIYIFESNEGMA